MVGFFRVVGFPFRLLLAALCAAVVLWVCVVCPDAWYRGRWGEMWGFVVGRGD